jgi:hypothetical protein
MSRMKTVKASATGTYPQPACSVSCTLLQSDMLTVSAWLAAQLLYHATARPTCSPSLLLLMPPALLLLLLLL